MPWLMTDEKFTHLINMDALKDTQITSMQDSNTPHPYQRDDFYVQARFRDPEVSMTKDPETGKETVYYFDDDDIMIFRGTFRACQKAQEIIGKLTNALDLEQEVNRALDEEDALAKRDAGEVTEHPKGTLG